MKNGSKKKSVALIFLLSVLPCGVHQLLECSAQNVQISVLVSGVAQNDTAIKRKIMKMKFVFLVFFFIIIIIILSFSDVETQPEMWTLFFPPVTSDPPTLFPP